jgi:hypothetical protein
MHEFLKTFLIRAFVANFKPTKKPASQKDGGFLY